jgi:hypothetical protein
MQKDKSMESGWTDAVKYKKENGALLKEQTYVAHCGTP